MRKFIYLSKIFNFLITCTLILLVTSSVKGQNYVQLADASGYQVPQDVIESINTSALNIEEALDVYEQPNTNFKFFDVGIYVNNLIYKDKEIHDYVDWVHQILEQEYEEVENYLVFLRISDQNGFNRDLQVHFSFNDDNLECISSNSIELIINNLIHERISTYEDQFEIQKEVAEFLLEKIEKGLCCSSFFGDEEKSRNTKNRYNSCDLDFAKVESSFDALINDEEWLEFLTTWKDIVLKFADCEDGDLDSYKCENGIIPKCLWYTSSPNSLNYDFALKCGMIDGAYSGVKEYVDFFKMCGKVDDALRLLFHSYTYYYVVCKNGENLNEAEYFELAKQLANPLKWQPQYSQIYIYIIEKLPVVFPAHTTDKENIEYCQKLEKCRLTVEYLNLIITNDVVLQLQLDRLWSFILGKYNDITYSSSLEKTYDFGYYGVKIAFEFIPISSIKNGGKVANLTEDLQDGLKVFNQSGYLHEFEKLALDKAHRILEKHGRNGITDDLVPILNNDIVSKGHKLENYLDANGVKSWQKLSDFPNVGDEVSELQLMDDLLEKTPTLTQEEISTGIGNLATNGNNELGFMRYCINGLGCFVEDTPVLVANKNYNISLGNTAKAMAVAASMPIVAVPIQDVQLLDYAVAHETVNATYGMTASTDDDIYLGLMDKDPYTSDQQRERDEYQLDDENWNEVVFEEVHGGSTAKLALHNDWINQKGYQVDAVVEMNLPEQGISGPFRITSIKHIIPQKKPVDDDEADEYNYRPVTALFTHESNQVFNILFDNGEELGVTYQHPIYSTTAGDWKLAGELEIGEEVLTKSGNTKVVSSTKKEGSETVYNLEVKELHNFLVGESGVVVHNNYIAEAIVTSMKAAIPAAFKKYGKCKEFAKALRTQLKANGVQNPKCYVAKVVDSQGNRVNVQLWHNGEKIADNGIHVFTPVNNKVFDNINHNGLETSLLDYTKVDYGGTGIGFETQFAHGYDVVFREVKQAEDILKIND